MEDVIDLARYPIDRPGSPDWWRLVDDCRAELDRNGLFNLPGFLRQEALARAVAEVMPVIDRGAFVHARAHNIYFENRIEDLPDTHPALTRFRTSNRTICSDQMDGALVIRLYEWPPFARFLAAAMDIPRLWNMDDPLARVNVMSYGDAQALNWHFDRSEFTITLLLQAPESGGAFEYAKDLRSDDDPNLLTHENFYRRFHNRRELASWVGMTPTPWASGDTQRDQGISRDGPAWIRAQLVQMGWRWLRHQPDSALSKWFEDRTAGGRGRIRRVPSASTYSMAASQ